MKAIILLTLLLFINIPLQAQTFDEIFKQKKTQKKYLLQQIAALQIYIRFAQKGYSIASQGISTIGDLAKGELDLHSSYISSLKFVNPHIKKYSKITDIVSLQLQVIRLYNGLMPALIKSDSFTKEEIDYVKHVFDMVSKDCMSLTEDLIDLTVNGKLSMTDDERLSRINSLHLSMQKNYVFSKDFSDQAINLANARKQDSGNNETIKTLYGIK